MTIDPHDRAARCTIEQLALGAKPAFGQSIQAPAFAEKDLMCAFGDFVRRWIRVDAARRCDPTDGVATEWTVCHGRQYRVVDLPRNDDGGADM
jgi:hypothetical protein